jgi:uncharacterized protein YfaS (alpha-2-macroglobulin family)
MLRVSVGEITSKAFTTEAQRLDREPQRLIFRQTPETAFVVPPTKAEEMYHPETFGRGKTDRVRIQ